jgi:type I restriction enzyme S subunit
MGDLFKVKHGFAFDGKYFASEGEYVLLSPGNFHDSGGFKLKDKEKYFTGDIPEDYVLSEGDLLVAMTEQAEGLLGSSALIPSSNRFLHNQRLGLITDWKATEIDLRFLYYLFNTREVRTQIRASATGTKVRHTSPTRIGEVRVVIPRVETQRKIASVLSAYDDLIENNTRRIALLEEMAQSLYREWFVEYRFPGHDKARFVDSPLGKIPEGWRAVNLFDVADVAYGFPYKSKLFSTDPDGDPVIRIRDILYHRSGTFTTEAAGHKYNVTNGDILVGMDGDFHMCRWAGGHAVLNQRVARLRTLGELHQYVVFHAAKAPIEHFNATIVGTTVAHLGDKHLREIRVAMPSAEVCHQAEVEFGPMFDEEINLRRRTELLRATRDLLLPKLMSGQLDVEDLDIDTGETLAGVEA